MCAFTYLTNAQIIKVNRPRQAQTYSISGKVFIDNNGDGQSISDAGMTGVYIYLYTSVGAYISF